MSQANPRTIVITGASDGIGRAAAQELAALGQNVVLVGRDKHKTQALASQLQAPFHLADFSDFAQVHRLADELLEDYPRIDVLADNAGGIFSRRRRETADGHEMTIQVDYLSHYLLTRLLEERLVSSRASVIETSSIGHIFFGFPRIDDLDMRRHYDAQIAYGNAKYAQVLFMKELNRRWHARGVSTAAFHPGIIDSGFAKSSGSLMEPFYNKTVRRLMGTVEDGADTLVWLALGQPGKDWRSGEYFAHRRPAFTRPGVSNPVMARRLWEESARLVGLDA